MRTMITIKVKITMKMIMIPNMIIIVIIMDNVNDDQVCNHGNNDKDIHNEDHHDCQSR